jgi:fucose 4-O-acetylase-like acetyltransferase
MKKRLDYIDFVRGIGVLLMLVGHLGFGDGVYKIIYSFHMPLFFLLSGYLFSVPNRKKLLQRTTRLLIPYLSLGTIYLLAQSIIKGSFDMDGLGALLWDNSKGLAMESALWFLTAICICQLIYTVISKVAKNEIYRLLSGVAIGILACAVTNKFGIFLPFSMQAGACALIYFSVGDYLKDINISKIKLIIAVSLMVLFLGIAYIMPLHNMRSGMYGIIPITEIIAVVLSVALLVIGLHIPKALKGFLLHYGQNSIVYLGVNHLGIKIAQYIVTALGISNKYLAKIATLVLTIVILYVAVWLINNTFLCMIFGKKHKRNIKLTKKQSNDIIG